MPFAVFRQHQRKLIAVFAILAMGGFVLSDTLPRWVNSGGVNNNDYAVADIFDRPVRRSDIAAIDRERAIANQFMAGISGDPRFFGGNKQDELIDALILQHEADRLEIPATAAFAKRWIDQTTDGKMTRELFELILSRFSNQQISGDQLLTILARQIRIVLASQEVAVPLVTPLDVFQNYRDQTERASFKAVPFLVDSFVRQVGEPTDAEVRATYEAGKDLLPDPVRVAPGFKVPRRVRVEYVAIDASALAREIAKQLPESEVAAYYDGRRTEFKIDGLDQLPVDLFLGEPNLTPQRYLPFSEMKDSMTDALAKVRAGDQVNDLFEKINTEVIDPFADAYHEAEDNIRDAKKEGRSTDGMTLPKPNDALAEAAKKYNLQYEASPLMDQRDAESFGRIAKATQGSSETRTGKDFDHTLFEEKTALFNGIEFADPLGDRYLLRKTADEPAHVAPLSEVRDRVVRAWKVAKARPAARKAADEYAKKLKAEGAAITTLTVDDRPVITIDEMTKLIPGMLIPPRDQRDFRFERGPARPAEIRQIPEAGPALIDALFALKPGEVAVQPDLPETSFYVMVLQDRRAAGYNGLMGPSGGYPTFQTEARTEMMRRSFAAGMTRLREQANYKETKVGELIEGRGGETSE